MPPLTVALARSGSAILLAKALDEFTQFSPRRYESLWLDHASLDDTSAAVWFAARLPAFLAGDLSGAPEPTSAWS